MTIVRIDSHDTHGWQARVPVKGRRNGISMLCSDSTFGGPTQARRAAGVALRVLRLRALILERQRVAKELRQAPLAGRTMRGIGALIVRGQAC